MDTCSGALDGGAVMNVDTLTLSNCTISNCTAARYGGAVFDNLGAAGRGGDGKNGIITVDSCVFKNNTAKSGAAIHYKNAVSQMLTLKGACIFSGNKDIEGNADDICLGPDYKAKTQLSEEGSTTTPFAVESFSLESGSDAQVTLTATNTKAGMVLCSGGASYLDLFTYKNQDFEIVTQGSDLALKLITTTYMLTGENGS